MEMSSVVDKTIEEIIVDEKQRESIVDKSLEESKATSVNRSGEKLTYDAGKEGPVKRETLVKPTVRDVNPEPKLNSTLVTKTQTENKQPQNMQNVKHVTVTTKNIPEQKLMPTSPPKASTPVGRTAPNLQVAKPTTLKDKSVGVKQGQKSVSETQKGQPITTKKMGQLTIESKPDIKVQVQSSPEAVVKKPVIARNVSTDFALVMALLSDTDTDSDTDTHATGLKNVESGGNKDKDMNPVTITTENTVQELGLEPNVEATITNENPVEKNPLVTDKKEIIAHDTETVTQMQHLEETVLAKPDITTETIEQTLTTQSQASDNKSPVSSPEPRPIETGDLETVSPRSNEGNHSNMFVVLLQLLPWIWNYTRCSILSHVNTLYGLHFSTCVNCTLVCFLSIVSF